MSNDILKHEAIYMANALERGDGLSVLRKLCDKQKTINTRKVLEHIKLTHAFMNECAIHMRKLEQELPPYCEVSGVNGGIKITMTHDRPSKPGWYWYQLSGSWAMQPCYVFTLGHGRTTLYYTLQPIGFYQHNKDIDCFAMEEADDDSVWSEHRLMEPNAKSIDREILTGNRLDSDKTESARLWSEACAEKTIESVGLGCDRCDTFGGNATYQNQVAMPISGRAVCIDWCIHHIVAALNAAGLKTVACCCGHGRTQGRIDLEDGRVLMITRHNK
jgi:hypothetical protein